MERRNATILFADLRGFSAVVGSAAPQLVFDGLNRWVAGMGDVVAGQKGSIAGFMGDAVMAVFDAPYLAISSAVEMQLLMADLNAVNRQHGIPDLFMSIGVHSGEVMVGTVGSKAYSTRTVIGEDVNLAARIEAFALRGQILASEATCALCADHAETSKPIEVFVKGREQAIFLREIYGLPAEGKVVPRLERRRSPRVPVRIPFAYQLLGNDVVSQVRGDGTILDLGQGGMLVQVERNIGLFEEIKIDVEFPLVGYRARDIYARVVNVKRHFAHRRCGVEFTSLGEESGRSIRKLLHLLIQGAGAPSMA